MASRDALPADWWRARRAELLALAAEHAPCYVYALDEVLRATRELGALASVDRVLYALKANAHPEIVRSLSAAGIDPECVSLAEVEHALAALPGIAPERLLFTPNFAPRIEYERALALGVRVTLDDLYPLERWPGLFAGRELFLRVDRGHGQGHHPHVRTAGAAAKFGIPLADLDQARALARRVGAEVVGLSAHTGSGVFDPENWGRNAEVLAEAARLFPATRVLDLGGGLGVPYGAGEAALDLAALDARLAAFRARAPAFELWLEPGRFLVARAGVLLARVTQTKRKRAASGGGAERLFVGVETGMNSLVRPALYGAEHRVVNLSRLDEPAACRATVVGPICESGDRFGEFDLPRCAEGDVLLVADTGAYGRVMASHYNLRAPAGERILPATDRA
jgi:diaminopimelate decarboxylase/aspartate kinase